MKLNEAISHIGNITGAVHVKDLHVINGAVRVKIHFLHREDAVNFCRCWADSISRYYSGSYQMLAHYYETKCYDGQYIHWVQAAHEAPPIENIGSARK